MDTRNLTLIEAEYCLSYPLKDNIPYLWKKRNVLMWEGVFTFHRYIYFQRYIYLILVHFQYRVAKSKPLQKGTGKIYATYTVFSV